VFSSIVPDGQWGGEHVSLRVAGPLAQLQFDCVHGSIQGPLGLDREGRFERPGLYVQESGVPPARTEERPARYSGRLLGSRLDLAIAFSDGSRAPGPFQLIRGEPGRVFLCP